MGSAAVPWVLMAAVTRVPLTPSLATLHHARNVLGIKNASQDETTAFGHVMRRALQSRDEATALVT